MVLSFEFFAIKALLQVSRKVDSSEKLMAPPKQYSRVQKGKEPMARPLEDPIRFLQI